MSLRIAVLLSFIAAGAAAEERCMSYDTPRQCLRRLIEARVYHSVNGQLAGVTTAPNVVASPVRSGLRNFSAAPSVYAETSTANNRGARTTYDYNLAGFRPQLNVQITLAEPRLSEAVLRATPDLAAQALLLDGLNIGDDVVASATLNAVTRHFGRSVEPHRALFGPMLEALAGSAISATAAVPPTAFDTSFAELFPDAAARITSMVEFELAAANVVLPPAVLRLTDDIARLTHHQPQLFATVQFHHRQPLLGAHERAYRLTWEVGADNLNAFRRNEGRHCEERGNCLIAFNDYASRTAAHNRNGRLSLAIEYRTTDQNDPGLTAPPIIELASRAIVYSAAYTQEVAFVAGRPTRIDLTLNHEGRSTTRTFTASGVSYEPSPVASAVIGPTTQVLPPSTTRFAAAATVTQPIWGGFSAPLSLVWTDRTQWLPGTPPLTISPPPDGPAAHTRPFSTEERGFEVRVGLRYQLPSFSRPRPPKQKECCCR